jgi:hypothetical protein
MVHVEIAIIDVHLSIPTRLESIVAFRKKWKERNLAQSATTKAATIVCWLGLISGISCPGLRIFAFVSVCVGFCGPFYSFNEALSILRKIPQ